MEGSPPNSSSLRLHTKRKDGGRELMSVRATVRDDITKIQDHIRKMALNDDLLSERLRQQGPSEEEEEEERPSWTDKALHQSTTNR